MKPCIAITLLPLAHAFLVSYYIGKQCHGQELLTENVNSTCQRFDGPKVKAASFVVHRGKHDVPNAGTQRGLFFCYTC